MWGITSITNFGVSKEFYIQLKGRLYRMAFAWCHDPHLAADLVQETLQKTLKKHHQSKNDESFDVILFTMLVHCWRDHCRRICDRVDINEVILDNHADLEHGRGEVKVINRVHRAISQLTQQQRQIVTLVDLEGMSYKHVGQVLGISVEIVMTTLCQARRHLVEQLHDVVNELDTSVTRDGVPNER